MKHGLVDWVFVCWTDGWISAESVGNSRINYQPELVTAGYLNHQEHAKGGIDTLLFEVIWRWTKSPRHLKVFNLLMETVLIEGFSQHSQQVSNLWKGAEKVKEVSILLFSGFPLRRWPFELTIFSRGTPRCRRVVVVAVDLLGTRLSWRSTHHLRRLSTRFVGWKWWGGGGVHESQGKGGGRPSTSQMF